MSKSSSDDWQVFIRHAHRDNHDRALDNGLSEKGLKQGGLLVEALMAMSSLGKPSRVLSSPKLRCLQTAQFVANWAGVEVEEEADLDEQGPRETPQAFVDRIVAFIKRHKSQKGLAFCSHGDVLPLIARYYGSSRDDIKKGDFFLVREGCVELFNAIRG